MSSSKRPRSPSMDSHDAANDSGEDVDHAGEPSEGAQKAPRSGGKKGKTKADKETDRKAQNRQAQRDFRQRKQQHLKELEAKLAMYEMGRDEQVERMVNAVRMLLEENQQLRTLLTQLSGFIGEGLGSCLPRIGLEVSHIIDRTLFDNAADALKLPVGAKSPSTSIPATGAPIASTSAHTLDTPVPVPSQAQPSLSAYTSVFPSTSSTSQLPFSSATPSSAPLSQPSLIPQFDYSQFVLSSAPRSTAANPFEGYDQPYATLAPPPPVPSSSSSQRPPPPQPQPVSQPSRQSSGASSVVTGAPPVLGTADEESAKFMDVLKKGNADEVAEHSRTLVAIPSDGTQMQAMQLIGYHMRNKHDNPAYHLPPCLRMSAVQQTVPHHPFLDGIIFPSLRDRLILLKDQYSVQELLSDFGASVEIHGDDLLTPEAWELKEGFLKKYWYVVDQEVLDISNRWRKERGETPLSMRCIVPAKDSTGGVAGGGE